MEKNKKPPSEFDMQNMTKLSLGQSLQPEKVARPTKKKTATILLRLLMTKRTIGTRTKNKYDHHNKKKGLITLDV